MKASAVEERPPGEPGKRRTIHMREPPPDHSGLFLLRAFGSVVKASAVEEKPPVEPGKKRIRLLSFAVVPIRTGSATVNSESAG